MRMIAEGGKRSKFIFPYYSCMKIRETFYLSLAFQCYQSRTTYRMTKFFYSSLLKCKNICWHVLIIINVKFHKPHFNSYSLFLELLLTLLKKIKRISNNFQSILTYLCNDCKHETANISWSILLEQCTCARSDTYANNVTTINHHWY